MNLGFLFNLGGAEILILLLFLALGLVWIITLIKIIRSDFKNPNDKIMWVVIVCILGLIGAILYLIFGEKNRIKNNSTNV